MALIAVTVAIRRATSAKRRLAMKKQSKEIPHTTILLQSAQEKHISKTQQGQSIFLRIYYFLD